MLAKQGIATASNECDVNTSLYTRKFLCCNLAGNTEPTGVNEVKVTWVTYPIT